MTEVKRAAYATLIGDVVGSRDAADRRGLHALLQTALSDAQDQPEELRPLSALRITVGDEYQGTFASVGAAVRAAFRIRLAVLPLADLRHGIGWGEVEVLQEEPRVEDGPGWWAARSAIEQVEADAEVAGTRRVRTRYRRAPGAHDGPAEAAVDAALLCRDQLVDPGDGRSVRLLRGYLHGRSQTAIAEQEGISPSAVSQRGRASGFAVIAEADRLLAEVR